MPTRMSAEQLIAKAAECMICGKIHKSRPLTSFSSAWAAQDGHSYLTRIHKLTNQPPGPVLQALQMIAAGEG
jgi:hypothetical protein